MFRHNQGELHFERQAIITMLMKSFQTAMADLRNGGTFFLPKLQFSTKGEYTPLKAYIENYFLWTKGDLTCLII